MSGYTYIEFMNIEPLRIADDSSSQMGQTTTMHFVPGTTIRGLVINELSKRKDFESFKESLFSDDVKFLNAYPIIKKDGNTIALLPSPKGFYEDKTTVKGRKLLENVVLEGKFTDGNKRASLGEYAFIERCGADRVLRYLRVSTGSDLKIKINLNDGDEQTVFRNEYIMPGNRFAAYIKAEDDELLKIITSIFSDVVILGNARTAGLGKCRILKVEKVNEIPYQEYAMSEDAAGNIYMMLLSHTVMRDSETGEYCGLDLKKLAEKLGVTNLNVSYCATTSVDVRGYNRKWGVRIPSVTMYEKGSVFKMTYDNTLSAEKMRTVMDEGIGVRTNEGFGRVLFIADYESVKSKEAYDTDRTVNEPDQAMTGEDEKILRVIARNYYRNLYHRQLEKYVVDLGFDGSGVKPSKLGKIEAFTTMYRYDYKKARINIDQFLEHAREKEGRQRVFSATQTDISNLDAYVRSVLSWNLENFEKALDIRTKDPRCVMGIPKTQIISDDELGTMKLELITKVIRYDNKKKGGKN